MAVKFGFGLINCQRFPGDARSEVELYREALMLTELAEELGFDSAWTSEHHFFNDSYMPSLLPMVAAMAARTTTISLGTALLLAPLYEAIRLAEDATTVDLIAEGRFILGLGQGWRPEEFEVFGQQLSERGRALGDTVTVLREAWSDGLVHGSGTRTYPGVFVTPKPSRPEGVPIWIGAMAERAVRRAGRIADGFIAVEATPEGLAQQTQWAREEAEQAGRNADELSVAIALPTLAWHGSDPWRQVRDHRYYLWWKYEDMQDSRGKSQAPQGPPPLQDEVKRLLLDEYNMGSPDQVVDTIGRYAEAAGGDLHYIAWLYYPGFDPDFQREIMHLFAEEVMPHLR